LCAQLTPGLSGLGLGLETSGPGLGLGLETSGPGLGLGLETSGLGLGLGLETSGPGLGLGLVFLVFALALASFKAKAKVKVTDILPNTVYHGIITLTVHWYTGVIGTAIVRRQVLFGSTR